MFKRKTGELLRKRSFVVSLVLLSLALILIFVAGRGNVLATSAASSTTGQAHDHDTNIVALSGYQVELFAASTSSYSHPDLLVVDKNHVFIDYQNYTEMPNDSGVASALGTVAPSTGIVTPFAIGFGSPTGMLFVPDGGNNE